MSGKKQGYVGICTSEDNSHASTTVIPTCFPLANHTCSTVVTSKWVWGSGMGF